MKNLGYKVVVLICFIALVLILPSCGDDDLKNATAISSKKITLTKDRFYDFDVIYSDSAKVKAKGLAPIYDAVTPSQGSKYSEMPKGVKIQFYNDLLLTTGTITSDYAINKEIERITVFRKHVVVVTPEITFTTEELTWDENKRTFNSPAGTVVAKDGSVVTGTQFSAPQDFSTYKIIQAAATTTIKGDLTP